MVGQQAKADGTVIVSQIKVILVVITAKAVDPVLKRFNMF